jgi:glucose-1-phosphate thymidylyltransferase
MIFYPLETLVGAGIRDILIVTGGNSAGDFLRLLRNGNDFGLRRLNYAYQDGEAGIADALRLAEEFADGDKICVILGDNITNGSIAQARSSFERQDGAKILLKEVSDPERFGVPVFETGHIVAIEEKPTRPKSRYAVVGIYFYDNTVFSRISQLTPSARADYDILDGWWTDAGTFESLWRATCLVREVATRELENLMTAGRAR